MKEKKASPVSRKSEKLYELLSRVPKGKITTYKELAHALGTKGYRAVGNILNKNPFAPKVPCHRVVMTNGTLGGYAGGKRRKIELLAKEGIQVLNNGMIQDFEKVLFLFD